MFWWQYNPKKSVLKWLWHDYSFLLHLFKVSFAIYAILSSDVLLKNVCVFKLISQSEKIERGRSGNLLTREDNWTTPTRMHNHHSQPPSSAATTTTTTTSCILLTTTLLSIFLILSFSSSSTPNLPPRHPSLFPLNSPHRLLFLSATASSAETSQNPPALPTPPSIAYLISGSSNDTGRILRLLFSIYHPKNTYLLHLDSRASQDERDSLARKIDSFPLFRAAQNVNVIGKADVVYREGSSFVSSTLHGASILLRISNNWDWFINLSVDDYPLVTQDGKFCVFIIHCYRFCGVLILSNFLVLL